MPFAPHRALGAELPRLLAHHEHGLASGMPTISNNTHTHTKGGWVAKNANPSERFDCIYIFSTYLILCDYLEPRRRLRPFIVANIRSAAGHGLLLKDLFCTYSLNFARTYTFLSPDSVFLFLISFFFNRPFLVSKTNRNLNDISIIVASHGHGNTCQSSQFRSNELNVGGDLRMNAVHRNRYILVIICGAMACDGVVQLDHHMMEKIFEKYKN